MAQLDMKNCWFRIRDGYDGPGTVAPLVNNVAGYDPDDVTMLVDTVVGALAVGDRFTVAGDDTKYTITAHSETGGNTTSITFTPGLADAVADNAALTILGHEIEIKIGEGNFTYDEKRNIEYKKNRGNLDTVRKGDQEAMDVRFDFVWEYLRSVSGATTPTIEEALKQKGAAATWTSTSADPCEPYCVDLEVEYIPPCGSVDKEYYLVEDFRYESLNHDFKAGTVACTGKSNREEATITRVAG